jgi:hypothetical protein
MKKFVGTKIVNATRMTRKEYNDLRGWTLPKDENGKDEGYLLEYPESAPNHSEYAGYISWSPAEQFESAYVHLDTELTEPYQVRLVAEFTQLQANVAKLSAFINGDKIGELSPVKADLMRRQLDYMNMLVNTLEVRIALEANAE